MTGVDFSLLIGALVCALISWRNRRGVLWLAAGALSYVISTIAWRMELPAAEVITALGDTAVCLCVYLFGQYRWEMWIWRLFQGSVLVSIIYLASTIGITSRMDHEIYAIAMEAVNWLLLIFIGGMGIVQRIGASDVRAGGSWSGIYRALSSLYRERTRDSFHRVPR